jgi:hypothetical protein
MVGLNKIRIGKDIAFAWEILTGGEALPLGGRDLRLYVVCPEGRSQELPYSVEGNVLRFTLEGRMQKRLGVHLVTLWENVDKVGQTVVDKGAVDLVPHVCYEQLNSVINIGGLTVVNLGQSDIALGNVHSIQYAEQTETATESGGVNTLTLELSNGQKIQLKVRNGERGEQGKPGLTGADYIGIFADKQKAIREWVRTGMHNGAWMLVGEVTAVDLYSVASDTELWDDTYDEDTPDQLTYLGVFGSKQEAAEAWVHEDMPVPCTATVGKAAYYIDRTYEELLGEKSNVEPVNMLTSDASMVEINRMKEQLYRLEKKVGIVITKQEYDTLVSSGNIDPEMTYNIFEE